jgi:hypothetical protein
VQQTGAEGARANARISQAKGQSKEQNQSLRVLGHCCILSWVILDLRVTFLRFSGGNQPDNAEKEQTHEFY